MQKRITDSIKFLTGSFCFNLELAKRNYTIEGIHQLRVSVKKIRALKRMTKELYPEESEQLTSLRYLRKIFKYAALLRDIHIIKSLFSEYNNSIFEEKISVKFFNKQEKKAKKEFRKSLKYQTKAINTLFDLQNAFINIYITIDSDKIAQDIDNLINNRLSYIKDLLNLSGGDDDIHKIRIKLKELNFIMSIRNNTDHEEKLFDLKNIALELGAWHDRIILLNQLKLFLTVKNKKRYNLENFILFYISVEKENIKNRESIKTNLQNIILSMV